MFFGTLLNVKDYHDLSRSEMLINSFGQIDASIVTHAYCLQPVDCFY